MFKPKPMTKIRITGLNSSLKQVVDALYELKIMHLVEFKKNDEFLDTGTSLEEAAEYSDQIVKSQSAISFFELKGNPVFSKNFSSSKKKFTDFFNEFSSLQEELSGLKSKESELQNLLLDPLLKVHLEKKYLENYENIVIISGVTKKPVKAALERAGVSFDCVEQRTMDVFGVVVFAAKKDEQKVRQVLFENGFSEQSLRHDLSEKQVEMELKRIDEKIVHAKGMLKKLGEENKQFLLDYNFSLKELNEKAQAPIFFGVSKNVFVATGWVPSNVLSRLNEKISKTSSVHVDVSESKDNAPIALENPNALKPFEFFLDLYTLPKYTELDPSFLMAITFPLFFGFMLGDVGYGIVTLLLFLFLRSKTKGVMKSLSGVLIWGSIATIIFGVVFGEVFGLEVIEHPILNRVHDPSLVLGVAVFVGFLHINLGLLLGFYNELKSHGFVHAFLAKLSWIILQIGLVLLAVDALGFAQIGVIPGAVVSLAAVVMLYLGEGAKGLVELPSIFSNMLSYGRLFAVGLSSVSIALVVNEMAAKMFEGGLIGIVIGIIILVIGHVLNIALGLIGPSLHSIRLHYVEFFSKFFHGGGAKYRPFGQIQN